jgi:glycine betaine/proline transport system substrate-binding protein
MFARERERMILRRALSIISLAAVLGALVAGCGGGAASSENKELTIGYIEWDEDVAVSNLTKVLLEEDLGYENVRLQLADVGLLFSGVAGGDLDAFQDVWLPTTHKTYWEKHQDEVVDLGQWYEGEASLGLAVPEYVEAQSIGDLAEHRDEFGGKIVGIEPGSGIMSVTAENAIPEYDLDYDVIDSSTPAMLAEVKNAVDAQEPIVFTAWKPHWMFTAYPIRYLEDPKEAMGGSETISAIARQGLEEDNPGAFALLENINLTEDQLGELELAINDAGDPVEGVKTWLGENRDVVEPWIDAARQAQEGQ